MHGCSVRPGMTIITLLLVARTTLNLLHTGISRRHNLGLYSTETVMNCWVIGHWGGSGGFKF